MCALQLTVGTFNLNNLFSRYCFKGNVAEAEISDATGSVVSDVKPAKAKDMQWVFRRGSAVYVRQYKGKLIKPKPDEETLGIAERIKEANLDVLAVQEVEDLDTLRDFNHYYLGDMYPQRVLVEGNDKRLIDVALLSKYPLGRVTSWQKYVYPEGTGHEVFDRDLLEVEVWDKERERRLFTIFNNHLKSQYVPFDQDPAAAKEYNDKHRTDQAQAIKNILKDRAPNEPFILLGDMNDALNAPTLQAFADLGVINGLAHAQETRPFKKTNPLPPTTIWTHRFGGGANAKYELFDQIWVSQALSSHLGSACIGRRKTLGGDGSDHDPAWVQLEF